MANNQSETMYACGVQLKSGNRYTMKKHFKESEIESFTDMLFKEPGYIEVDADSKYNIKFIKAIEIECVTWQFLDL